MKRILSTILLLFAASIYGISADLAGKWGYGSGCLWISTAICFTIAGIQALDIIGDIVERGEG